MLEELLVPLEKTYADEFTRYTELFYKYLPKRPYFDRFRYGDGFFFAKAVQEGWRGLRVGHVALPISASIWTTGDGSNVTTRRIPPNFWLAMNSGRKSSVKAIDFDNKQNLLGYYPDVAGRRGRFRPCPWSISRPSSRLYDAFPQPNLVRQLGDPGPPRLAEDGLAAACRCDPGR